MYKGSKLEVGEWGRGGGRGRATRRFENISMIREILFGLYDFFCKTQTSYLRPRHIDINYQLMHRTQHADVFMSTPHCMSRQENHAEIDTQTYQRTAAANRLYRC